MPVLYILAGPNGTGKTTFYSIAVQNNFIGENLPFINVDIITQSLGNYNEENYAKAEAIYRDTVKNYIESNADFMIESNLATARSYDWVSLIKRKGYQVILYYLSTDDVMINKPGVALHSDHPGGFSSPFCVTEMRIHTTGTVRIARSTG